MSDNNMDLEVARQLIEKDKLKREKAKLATKRYRERIISNQGKDAYLKIRNTEMKNYRKKQADKINQAYILAGKNTQEQNKREEQIRVQSRRVQQAEKSKEKQRLEPLAILSIAESKKRVKDLTPAWFKPKRGIIMSVKEFKDMKKPTERRPFTGNGKNNILTDIRNTHRFLYKQELSREAVDLLQDIYRGEDIGKNDLFEYFPYLHINRVEGFANKLAQKYTNLSSWRKFANNFINILSRAAYPTSVIKNMKKDTRIKEYLEPYEYLSRAAIENFQTYAAERQENISKDTIIADFSEQTMLEKLKEIPDKLEGVESKMKREEYQAIFAVYTLIQPRRLLDYEALKLEEEGTVLSDSDNYLLLDGRQPVKMIFNKYKTSDTYDQQEVKVSGYLQEYLKKHIDSAKLKIGDYVFGSVNNRKIPRKSLSNTVSYIFTGVYGKKITLNDVRQSAVTYFYEKPRTVKEIQKFSTAMGHSIKTNLEYRRFKEEISDDLKDAIKKQEENNKEEDIDTNKVKCNICGKVVKKTNLKRHQQTKTCKEAGKNK